MGLTYVTTQLFDFNRNSEPYEAEFLVDTGSIDCMAPGDELEKIGIEKEGKSVYELANGEIVEYELGFARVMFMGQETATPDEFHQKMKGLEVDFQKVVDWDGFFIWRRKQ